MKTPVSKLAGSAAKAEEFVRMQLLELYRAVGLGWTAEHPSIEEFILHFRPRQDSFTNIVRVAELLETLQFARKHSIGMEEVFRYMALFQDHFPGRNACSAESCVSRAIEYRCPPHFLNDLRSLIGIARSPFFPPEHTSARQKIAVDLNLACTGLPWPDFFSRWEAFVTERTRLERNFSAKDCLSYTTRLLRRHEKTGHIFLTDLFRTALGSESLSNIAKLHGMLTESDKLVTT